MRSRTTNTGVSAITVGISLTAMAGVTLAQQGSIAAMFNDDQQRVPSLAASFTTAELPATSTAGSPLRLYLSAGDLERAFDRSEFRPDATIIPTNTDLQMTAAEPTTQRVLISRVQKQPDVMRDLESQVATRRQQSSALASGEPGLLRIGIDTFVARLAPGNTPSQGRSAGADPSGAFPKTACFVATDFPKGDAVDRRELFLQDRMRQGIAACLEALDTAGARTLVLPLLGAASSTTQNIDAQYEGQRILKECRLLNSTAGIALGIHDFAARRRNLREIGIVQWDRELTGMFSVDAGSPRERTAQAAYRAYAKQVSDVFRKGLAGQKITAGDLQGNCTAILNGK
jgi:hypothetical protein